jgi:hypothetical protein
VPAGPASPAEGPGQRNLPQPNALMIADASRVPRKPVDVGVVTRHPPEEEVHGPSAPQQICAPIDLRVAPVSAIKLAMVPFVGGEAAPNLPIDSMGDVEPNDVCSSVCSLPRTYRFLAR